MKNIILLIFILHFRNVAIAADKVDTKNSCATVKRPADLLRCILKNGAEVQREKANIDQQNSSLQTARQFTNPNLGIDSIGSSNGGRDNDITLLFPIEFGKRSARIEVAEANIEIAKKQLLTRKEELAIQVVSSLYRLRQLDSEIELLKEASETFHGINKSYRNRLKLNPEQEVALSVFEIASEENELRLVKLSNERDRISATVSYDLGGPINNDLLPPIKTEWENLSLEATQSSTVALSEALEKKANSELSLARSEAFPELHLGPKLRYNTGEKSETTIGLSLSMTLPILNQNNGAKESARYNLQRTSLETAITKTKINTERELLIKSYNRSAEAIKHAQATTRLNERHKSLHKLISQGVVSASLVIELHRQLFEYQSALHDQEITGIEALWKLYAIDGSIAEGQE